MGHRNQRGEQIMNEETAIDIIKSEFAKHGNPTKKATCAYIESGMHLGSYNRAKRAGQDIYRMNTSPGMFDGVVKRAMEVAR